MAMYQVFTDKNKEFTDRFFVLQKHSTTRKYEFDCLCAEINTEHQLILPMYFKRMV